MANIIKHRFESAVADGPETTEIRPSNWNDEHVVTGGNDDDVLVRDSGESDGVRFTNLPIFGAVQFLLTDPVSPVNGQLWVTASGSSPTRSIKLKLRDLGVTVTIIEIFV